MTTKEETTKILINALITAIVDDEQDDVKAVALALAKRHGMGDFGEGMMASAR